MMSSPAFDVARFAPLATRLYLVALCVVLLYPFQFSAPFNAVENTAKLGPEGVTFGTAGMLRSAGPVAALYRSLSEGSGLAVEVWLRTASTDQAGPARIMSYSLDPLLRNFMLGQEGSALNVRLRTTETDRNGTHPDLMIANAFVPNTMQHLVVSYDFKAQRVYVDGRRRADVAVPQGTFGNWDPTCFLVFGNEATGARPWQGTLAYAAIYDRPLSEGAVRSHFQAGLPPHRPSDGGALLAFDFRRGPAAWGIPLVSPDRVETQSRLVFSFFRGAAGEIHFVNVTSVWDVILNVVLFLPFGFLLAARLDSRFRSAASVVFVTVLAGSLLSTTFEGLQIFIADRTSSLLDVITNTAGTLLGALAYTQCSEFLTRHARA